MKVSIDSVIDSAKFRLGLRDTSMADADLERLINEGAMHIDSVDTYAISCVTLEVDCGRALLPEGFVEVICLQIVGQSSCSGCCESINFNPEIDQNPTSIACTCPQFFVANRNVLTEFCGMGASCGSPSNVFDVQGGYLVFSSNFKPTEIKMWYRTYNMDDDGIMVLDEYWQRGLSAYAAYMYAMAGQNMKAYMPQQVTMWQQEWTAQVNKIRGKSAQRDHRQHKATFASIARAILLNPASVLNNNI